MNNLFNINHVNIVVSNMEESINFYKKFGFTEFKKYEDENIIIVLLKLNDTLLELFYNFSQNAMPNSANDLKTVGNKHFGLGVTNIEEAKDFVIKNKLYNGEIKIKQGRLGKPYFFIKDPNGIDVEIIENQF